jgi:hypothetical protein
MTQLFFICRILPTIFFFYYNKIAYILSHITFTVSTVFNWIKPIILYVFKCFLICIKFLFFISIFILPILYVFIKNNFLIFTKKVKIRKLFFINNLYNSFSSKILLSGTAFFSIYVCIFMFAFTIVLPLFVLKQQGILVGGLDTLDENLVGKMYFNVKTQNTLNFSFLENIIFKNEKSFNNLSLTRLHFFFCLTFSLLIFILLNVIHSFLAFLSLCYDYLLKKLNSENFFVLFIISSTTLQIFFKLLNLLLIL